jgi:hypothetical protein
MADEGVIAPLNQYVQVYLNGQFYGLYGMIERVRGGGARLWHTPGQIRPKTCVSAVKLYTA